MCRGPRDTASAQWLIGMPNIFSGSWFTGSAKLHSKCAVSRQCSGSGLAAQERGERPAVGLQRHLGPDELADGGQHVDGLGHRVDDRAAAAVGLGRRVDDDQGHVVALVPVAELLQQPVVAAHLAVVARDDDQGRLGQPAPLQVVEERRQPVVDLALRAVVGGAELPALPLVARARRRRGIPMASRAERVDGRLLLGRRAAGERPDRLGLVEVVVAERVPAGRVGTDERGVDEEGLVTVALEPLDHGLAHERRLGELDGEPRRSPGRPVVPRRRGNPSIGSYSSCGIGRDVDALRGEPAPPGRAALLPGVLDQGAETRQDALVAEQPRVARRHRPRIDRGVGVPEEHGVVARLRGPAAPRW